MNDLIKINIEQVDGQDEFPINARELHKDLEVQTRFDTWFNRRIKEYGFEAEKDYCSKLSIRSDCKAGKPKTEYWLSMDMGKELAMVEKTDKGRMIRKYFIQVEEQARGMVKALVDTEKNALLLGFDSERQSLIGTIRDQQSELNASKQETDLYKQLSEVRKVKHNFGEIAKNGNPKIIYRKPTYAALSKMTTIVIPEDTAIQLRLGLM